MLSKWCLLRNIFPFLAGCQQTALEHLVRFPGAKGLPEVKEHIDECVHLSWMLAVQVPPMTIACETTEFSDKLHGRFMSSDIKSLTIEYHVRPPSIDSQAGHALSRGIVVTTQMLAKLT